MVVERGLEYAKDISSKEKSMTQAIIGRWGKSLAVRLPGDIAKAAGLGDGERVELLSQNGEVVIRKAESEITIESMFRGKSPEEWRALYADAYDWGPDVGRERVDE
jgi:antitoxin MazE